MEASTHMNNQIKILRPALIASIVGFAWGISMTVKPYGTDYGPSYLMNSLAIGIVYFLMAFFVVSVWQGIRRYLAKPTEGQAIRNSKPSLFTAIASDSDALVAIQTSSWLIIATSFIALAFRLLAGNLWLGIMDAVLVIGLTVAVMRLHSRVAAVLLLALSVVSAFATGHNRFFGGDGGANLFMALLILWASVRLLIATFQTHSYRASPTASGSTMLPAAALNSPLATRTIETDIHGSTTNGSEEGGERLWAQALDELEGGNRRLGLWAKAFADAQGNEAAAKANYLRDRVCQLSEENRSRTVEVKQHKPTASSAQHKRRYDATGVTSTITAALVVLWVIVLAGTIGWAIFS